MGRIRQRYQRVVRSISRSSRGRQIADLELRKTEVRLLRRLTIATITSLAATVILTAVLLFLTYQQWRTADLQWRTAESTAVIERAKVRPHFRILQTDLGDERGFLPRTFTVQPDAGVSDATEASAEALMLIHYSSRELGLSGMCRARFSNFYSWANDALSFELIEPAQRLLGLSRAWGADAESSISFQPMWVVVRVSYLDIFGVPGNQHLVLSVGQSSTLNTRDFAGRTWAGIDLNIQPSRSGLNRVDVFRISTDRPTDDCVKALRVMNRINALRVARHYLIDEDRSFIVANEFTMYEGYGAEISATDPAPAILPSPR